MLQIKRNRVFLFAAVKKEAIERGIPAKQTMENAPIKNTAVDKEKKNC